MNRALIVCKSRSSEKQTLRGINKEGLYRTECERKWRGRYEPSRSLWAPGQKTFQTAVALEGGEMQRLGGEVQKE